MISNKSYIIGFIYMFLFMLLMPNLLALLSFLDRYFSLRFTSFGVDFIIEVIKASFMALRFALCFEQTKATKIFPH